MSDEDFDLQSAESLSAIEEIKKTWKDRGELKKLAEFEEIEKQTKRLAKIRKQEESLEVTYESTLADKAIKLALDSMAGGGRNNKDVKKTVEENYKQSSTGYGVGS